MRVPAVHCGLVERMGAMRAAAAVCRLTSLRAVGSNELLTLTNYLLASRPRRLRSCEYEEIAMTFGSGRSRESRRFGRRDTSYSGWIRVPGKPRQICIVRNLSLGGALLECARPDLLPYKFELAIEATNTCYLCEIRHSSATTVGVEFCAVERHDAPASSRERRGAEWGDASAERSVRGIEQAVQTVRSNQAVGVAKPAMARIHVPIRIRSS